MAFKLKAMIVDESTQKTPPEINLSTFGVWKGKEVCNYECPHGSLEDIRGQFRGMNKKSKNKPKPMTLSWFPLSGQESLFNNLKNKKLKIHVTVEQSSGSAKWILTFEGVKVSAPKPDYKEFPGTAGGPKKETRKDQRVDATFLNFIDDAD